MFERWSARHVVSLRFDANFSAQVPNFFLFMKRFCAAAFLLLFSLAVALRSREYSRAQSLVAPLDFAASVPQVFTSTRQINAITFGGETLWMATAGGVLRREANGAWRKWTRLDGLPSHEVQRIKVEGARVLAQTPRGVAELDATANRWNVTKAAPVSQRIAAPQRATWRGQSVEALQELRIGSGKAMRRVALPANHGSHVSALLARKNELLVALYGDGVWRFDGKSWRVLAVAPPRAKEITSLAQHASALFVGTRRDGVWQWENKTWTQLTPPEEPFDANVQNLESFGGALWVSTLEDGLLRFDGKSWRVLAPPENSSFAPRRTAIFGGKLWLQHGGGNLDVFDGKSWRRDVARALPRRKIFALASGEDKLYAAQWGGWSEYSRGAWTPFLRLPQLQGVVVTALLPDGDNLWLGTQNRGAAHFNRAQNTLTWHDERSGLPDDWITVFGREGTTTFAGTFVGGLAQSRGAATTSRWKDVEELRGRNVTALESDGQSGFFIATRAGLWRRAADGKLENLNARFVWLENEIQALRLAPRGLWIGGRTAIYFLPQEAW